MTTKCYLGDGVYATRRDGDSRIELTTEDGISETNRIWLEPEVVEALKRFLAITRQEKAYIAFINGMISVEELQKILSEES